MTEKLDTQKATKWAYVIVACSFLINFAANYPQYQLSPIAPIVMGLYSLDIAQFSALFSAAMIPGILLSLVAGLLSDRFGLKRCIGIAAILSAIAVVARIWVTDFTGLFLCMVFSGVVATFFNANVAKIMGRWFPPSQIGVAVAFAMVGSTAAMVFGMSATAMMPSIDFAYIVAAVISVIVALVWWIFVREKPVAASEAEAAAPPIELPSFSECIKVVAKNKFVWFTAISIGFILAANMMLNTFLPTALQVVKGMEATVAGGLSSVITIGSFCGTLIVPIVNAQTKSMRPSLIICCILAAVGTAFAWQAPEGIAMTVALFITGFCCSGVITTLLAVPVLLSGIGPVFAGTAGGLVATIQLLIGVVIPSYVATPILGENYEMLFIVGGVFALISLVFGILIPDVLKAQRKQAA